MKLDLDKSKKLDVLWSSELLKWMKNTLNEDYCCPPEEQKRDVIPEGWEHALKLLFTPRHEYDETNTSSDHHQVDALKRRCLETKQGARIMESLVKRFFKEAAKSQNNKVTAAAKLKREKTAKTKLSRTNSVPYTEKPEPLKLHEDLRLSKWECVSLIKDLTMRDLEDIGYVMHLCQTNLECSSDRYTTLIEDTANTNCCPSSETPPLSAKFSKLREMVLEPYGVASHGNQSCLQGQDKQTCGMSRNLELLKQHGLSGLQTLSRVPKREVQGKEPRFHLGSQKRPSLTVGVAPNCSLST